MQIVTVLYRKRVKKVHLQIFCMILLAIFINTSFSTHTYAQESRLPEAPIFIDNLPVKTKYIMRDGQLMVPSLFLKHTGVRVDWNEQYRSVVFTDGNICFALPVGQNYSDDFVRATGEWKRQPLSTRTIEFAGDIFVPLLDVTRKFGMRTTYNPQLERTFITTNIRSAPNFIYHGDPARKLVALTFDDGPDGYYTPKILDILKSKQVPATFFVMGKQVEAFPDVMRRIVNEGHGIANHTWSHPVLPRQMTGRVIEEIRKTQNIMEKTVGRKPDLFRPPFGAITKSDALVLHEMGFRTIMWSVDTLDWSGLSGDEILRIVQRDISPGGIVLQHNFQTDARLLDGTVEALPMIIDDLRAKGYRFVTVQTLLSQ
ncbi:polysaccharide deacetylase family protein [Alkalihalobacterium sp. APHAB7]|uniref:polysaccharide deacetylase family protein n=1 Tax=Alkalihalobacterium sp. APHAB7 TaxID=3402081 RepID=UPI003AAEFC1B